MRSPEQIGLAPNLLSLGSWPAEDLDLDSIEAIRTLGDIVDIAHTGLASQSA